MSLQRKEELIQEEKNRQLDKELEEWEEKNKKDEQKLEQLKEQFRHGKEATEQLVFLKSKQFLFYFEVVGVFSNFVFQFLYTT